MNRLNCVLALKRAFVTMMMLGCLGLSTLNSGCASAPVLPVRDEFLITLDGDPAAQKSIFVFLDGTGNDRNDNTNVWRLFEQLRLHKNSQTVGRYIPGVGSVKDELEDDPLLPIFGDALGRGMQARILAGYDFISEQYKPGDRIFIFGFSRGAHQARALAGLLAYAGVRRVAEENLQRRRAQSARMLKLLKGKRDEDFAGQWEAWRPSQVPLLAKDINGDNEIGGKMQSVEITFLGVWDTVPGSSFKDYPACKERIGIVKQYFHWVPLISKGERYKSGSYPPIRHIAHAVALDEKRTKFSPLYLCAPIAPQYTTVEERWFPGAHADVGGGYGNDDLPNVSLEWMIGLLEKEYRFGSQPERISGNPKGLAHWSLGDEPANIGSDCEDRTKVKERQPPLGYRPHLSIEERGRGGVMPIVIKGKIHTSDWAYPIDCPGPGK